MKKYISLMLCISILLLAVGCTTDKGKSGNEEAALQNPDTPVETNAAVLTDTPLPTQTPPRADTPVPTEPQASTADEVQAELPVATEAPVAPEMLHFVDVFGAPYEVEINPQVERQTYLPECFVHDGDRLSYVGDERYRSRLGIDVSSFQGDVDWAAVKDAGIEFVIIRLGYRGYGQAGTLCLDKKFLQNI